MYTCVVHVTYMCVCVFVRVCVCVCAKLWWNLILSMGVCGRPDPGKIHEKSCKKRPFYVHKQSACHTYNIICNINLVILQDMDIIY